MAEGSTAAEWEELTMSMGASFLDDAASKSSFQYPIVEGGGYPKRDMATSINPVHETSSGHGSEKIGSDCESPHSITANFHTLDEGEAGAPLEEVEVLPPVFAKNFGTDRAPKTKPMRSKISKAAWTIAIAATVMGISMLVHRLQAELHLNQQLQMELSVKDKKLDELVYQIYQLRRVIISSGL